MAQYDDDDVFYQQEVKKQQDEIERSNKKKRDLKSRGYVSHQKQRIKDAIEQKYLLGDKEHAIWPEGETHILSGPSGVGKSSVLLPLIKDWSEGKPVMGFPTTPLPYVYIMCDGSETSLQHRLERLGLGNWDIQGYSIEGIVREFHYAGIKDVSLDVLPDIFKWARVFFVEAINWFYKSRSASQAKDYVDTLHLASEVRLRYGSDKTIIGTSHEAKMTEGKKYANVRDRPHGTVAQPATSGTIMSMEKGGKGERLIHFSPRNYPEFTAYYKMKKGGVLEFQKLEYLELTPEGEEVQTSKEVEDTTAFRMLDDKIKRTDVGNIIARTTIVDWGEKLEFSEATVDRWIKTRVDIGWLQRVGRGAYILMKIQ